MTRNTATTPLEDIAVLSLEFGRLLMECGASARVVDEIVRDVARGLGAGRVDLRIGYASLATTVSLRSVGKTRMCKVGALGVNQRLDHSVRELARAVERGELTAAAARSALEDACPRPVVLSRLARDYCRRASPALPSDASWARLGSLRFPSSSAPPPSANGSAVNRPATSD